MRQDLQDETGFTGRDRIYRMRQDLQDGVGFADGDTLKMITILYQIIYSNQIAQQVGFADTILFILFILSKK